MGELLVVSQSSLLLLPQLQLGVPNRRLVSIGRIQASLSENSCMRFCSTRLVTIPAIYAQPKPVSRGMRVHVVSDSKMPTTFTVDSAGEGIDVLPDSGGSNDDLGGPKGGGGGGGGNDGGNDNGGSEGSGESDDHKGGDKKAKALSMSQKLTLGYATLVGVGGIMGYLKSGSQKSLIAGGGSALLLYLVYTMLPTYPVLASSLGFGMSASLLGVMGLRFKKSSKIFPAGVVSFVSLVMSGGYLHGILRSVH
ncbi:protein FATTY ACID EXPORT 2, chloroplastic-like [Olea europaea var. sylvestris]|uniref:protein FATTY ACID EXPORT 2, chloroplastic-like n=1 Tax=Olea europaea var. sylvestris TaxID=158386 RepID=UPI000C1D8D4E|nr:protein FATTY ACID EXPORT 2, chloroplastic-like [Olea europaea var. sylvestris]XP_022885809.1 protein FATTY ACID EXPORT 2, chloroplastic-like [Olea europaea var. sylvestris]XP_022885810.1 protein FATTY ACID EXPORT 2, chloroplastic-like [Olea europaea var. sylvestris]XP_022885811.1 protein FATTY ACID EXPORT 2, chloroplastic-like [Olea europaea var. sylvestris]XP_022885813.1 protein FATTY ACID EXPORT 2, chloroplastic-like [Olea europaea var. sylvestris]XP_022885814.1 protein FATTY ACID EXPORT